MQKVTTVAFTHSTNISRGLLCAQPQDVELSKGRSGLQLSGEEKATPGPADRENGESQEGRRLRAPGGVRRRPGCCRRLQSPRGPGGSDQAGRHQGMGTGIWGLWAALAMREMKLAVAPEVSRQVGGPEQSSEGS